jgi:hypothetical protein
VIQEKSDMRDFVLAASDEMAALLFLSEKLIVSTPQRTISLR